MTAAAREGILVLGTPRSGTTLLRRLLNAHPRIACPGETNVFTACGRFLRSERIAEDVRIGVVEGLGYAGFPADEVLRRLRDLAFSFHRDYAARQGKPRWASKTAFDAFYLREIERLCSGHVAFVCLQRHGLDVACSLQELCERNGGYLHELHEYVRQYPMVLEAFARVWVDLTQALLDFVARHADDALLIRYEDLVRDPDATMDRVLRFLGDTWDPAWTQRALADREQLGLGDWKTYGRTAVDAASVGRWRKLSPSTIHRLAEICNPTLERSGYPPAPTGAPPDPERSRRRYELGLLVQRLKTQREGGGGAGPASGDDPGRDGHA